MRLTCLLGDVSGHHVSQYVSRHVPVDATSWTCLSSSQESMQLVLKENQYSVSICPSKLRRGTFRKLNSAKQTFFHLKNKLMRSLEFSFHWDFSLFSLSHCNLNITALRCEKKKLKSMLLY